MIYRLGKKKKLTAEINVVPYIDVMLVLLIIFMVLSPLLIQGIEVNLQKTDTTKMSVQSETQPSSSGRKKGFSAEERQHRVDMTEWNKRVREEKQRQGSARIQGAQSTEA